jgi:hypothetical protein
MYGVYEGEKTLSRKGSDIAAIALCCEFGPTYPKFDLCPAKLIVKYRNPATVVRDAERWDHSSERTPTMRQGAHSPREPAARDLQTPTNGRAALHPNRVPPKRRACLVRRSARGHRQIYEGDDVVDDAFMGTDPTAADNRWLREAMEHQIPVIYFLGTSPGRYRPIIPTFIGRLAS